MRSSAVLLKKERERHCHPTARALRAMKKLLMKCLIATQANGQA
jgi:hypothetical protein